MSANVKVNPKLQVHNANYKIIATLPFSSHQVPLQIHSGHPNRQAIQHVWHAGPQITGRGRKTAALISSDIQQRIARMYTSHHHIISITYMRRLAWESYQHEGQFSPYNSFGPLGSFHLLARCGVFYHVCPLRDLFACLATKGSFTCVSVPHTNSSPTPHSSLLHHDLNLPFSKGLVKPSANCS